MTPESPTSEAPTSFAAPSGHSTVDVAHYTDFTPHAKGGLGEVLRATDGDLHRTVAVKRLQHRHADNPACQRRFLLEAEITARLEHPGVVPVYSLLRDGSSRPCYVMRFIEGRTLADAIANYHAAAPDPVAFRRLVGVFLDVCQTVAYAHNRGVLHRDLKPANVMVGKFGETLVVDWGLAKAVGRPDEVRAVDPEGTIRPSGSGSGETAMGSAVGTPAYMSPEQAAGRWDVIEPSSDIYSLGAMLYTLLTGKSPLAGDNWPELLQKIQRGDFPPPRYVNASAPRALEAVSLKAMALQPADRYASAQALAAEVEHYLADEPVTAYREPLPARAWRWVRRHRTLVSTAAALLLTGLVVSAVALVVLGKKNREVEAERMAARKAADQAEAINQFLTADLLGQANPDVNPRDNKVTVEDLLQRAARRIDAGECFAGQPEVEAAVRLVIGRTFHKLSNLAEAERHFRRAVELRREYLPLDHPQTLAAQEALADFLNLGAAKYAEAEPLAKRTWEARARVLGPRHRDTLDSMDTYCTSLDGLRRYGESIAVSRQCYEARREVLGADDPDTLTSMNNLAFTLVLTGKRPEAIALLRQAVDSFHKRPGSEHAVSLQNLAHALYLDGDLDEAEKLVRDGLEWFTPRLGKRHLLVSNLQSVQVRIWVERGDLSRAAAMGSDVVALRRGLFPEGHWAVGTALQDLGCCMVLQGKCAAAEKVLRESREVFNRTPPRSTYWVNWTDCWYAASLAGQGRFPEAASILIDAEQGLRASPMTPNRHHRMAVEQLVRFYEAWKKPDEAARWRAALAPSKKP